MAAQKITIDLKKSPEVAEAIADLQVGDEVEVRASIVTKDEQTLTLEVEQVIAHEQMEEKEEELPEEVPASTVPAEDAE